MFYNERIHSKWCHGLILPRRGKLDTYIAKNLCVKTETENNKYHRHMFLQAPSFRPPKGRLQLLVLDN